MRLVGGLAGQSLGAKRSQPPEPGVEPGAGHHEVFCAFGLEADRQPIGEADVVDRRAHRAPVLDRGAARRSFQPGDIRIVLLTAFQQLRREVETKVDRLLAAEGIANDHASVAEAGFDRQIVQRESSGRQPHRRDEAAVDVDVRRRRRAHGAPDLRRRIDGVVRIEILLRRETETADHRRTAERRRSPDRVAEDPAAPAANLIERQAGQSGRDRAGVVDAGGALEQRAEEMHAEFAVTGGRVVGRPVRGIVQEERRCSS